MIDWTIDSYASTECWYAKINSGSITQLCDVCVPVHLAGQHNQCWLPLRKLAFLWLPPVSHERFSLNRRRHAFQPNRIMHKIYIRFIRCCVSLLSLNIKSRIRIDASRYGTDGCKRVCRGVETERRSWYETTQRIAGINIEIDEYHSISEFGL